MLEQEIIAPSTSSYRSPLWVVPKKTDANGKKHFRVVFDYRELNKKSDRDLYKITNNEQVLNLFLKIRSHL